jgi:hypothetical protein
MWNVADSDPIKLCYLLVSLSESKPFSWPIVSAAGLRETNSFECLDDTSFHNTTTRPKRSSPMGRHRASPISGSRTPSTARAVDVASLLHGSLRVYNYAETEKK